IEEKRGIVADGHPFVTSVFSQEKKVERQPAALQIHQGKKHPKGLKPLNRRKTRHCCRWPSFRHFCFFAGKKSGATASGATNPPRKEASERFKTSESKKNAALLPMAILSSLLFFRRKKKRSDSQRRYKSTKERSI